MESPAEQSCSSQSTTSSEPLNWAMAMEVDGLSKRKSVSFVDEKLILDALNSTNSTTNGSGNGGKSSGKHNNHHHHQNSNGRSNGHGHSKGSSSSKSAAAAAAAATNGAKNNAVIVYYSDPQREINVDQLLTTTEPTKNGVNGSGGGGGGHQTNGHHRSNQNSRGQSNGNQHHHREHQHRDNPHRDQHRHQNRQNGSGGGGDEDRRRSAVLSNGHTPSKMADNWRTKGLRMDQPQYQPVRERIGNGHHHHPGNGGHSNGHSAGKANGRGQQQPKGGMPLLQSPGTTTTGNGKVSGTFPKQQQHQQKQQQSVPPPKPSSAPITIYYTTPECSTDVIEQNLKQLQLKQKAAEASSPVADSISENTTTTTEAGNGGSITLEKEGEEGEEAASRANGSTTTDAFSTSSITSSATTTTTSQVNVINNDKVELSESKSESESSSPESDAKSTSDITTTISSTAPAIAAAMPITLTAGGDQYDVINGGVPIAPATLPTTGERHPIRCTLVSHPGHFYVKFVDEAGEALLSTMNEFYSLEEHLIELSVELLRPGQYFAACRKRPPTAEREWIRVQLQSVEGPDLINCLLIDEGCFGIFRCADLQPLYNQFRAVAKQAVRASLSGVIPKEIDWLPQQSLDFKKLISDRPLHSGAQVFDQAAFEEKGCLQLELYFAEKGGDGTDDDGLAGRSVAEVIVERDIASKK